MEMDSRKQKILEAVVLDYIETAEPVGSRTISKKYNLGVSSATIRNEMADLEEMGLIEQPHTSAGRVPSNAGYRYYVDYLMSQSDIQEEAKQLIQQAVKDKQQQVSDVLRDSMKMLAEVTNCTTVMMLDDRKGSTLQLLQLLLVEPGKALMVIITEGDKIENRFLEIPKTMTREDLDLVSMEPYGETLLPLAHLQRGKPTRLDGSMRLLLATVEDSITLPHLTPAALSMMQDYLQERS